MKPHSLLLGIISLLVSVTALEVEQLPARAVATATYTASGIPPPCSYTSIAVPNGGFEDGLNGWFVDTLRNSTITVVSPGSNNSAYAAQLGHVPHDTIRSDAPYLQSPAFHLCDARKYMLGFDMLVPYTSPYCVLQVAITGGSTYTYKLTQRPWTHKSFPIRGYGPYDITVSADIHCNIESAINSTVLVDNFSITQLPGSYENKGCPRAQTPIVNGGFELGDFSNWSVDNNASNSNHSVVSGGPGPNSKYMFQADFRPAPAGVDFFELEIGHDVYNFCDGYNYTYTFDYRLQNYDTVNYPNYCIMQFIDVDCWGNLLDPTSNTKNLTLTNDWTHVEFRCNSIDSDVHQPQFDLLCGDGSGSVHNFTQFSWNVDNLALHYNPAPS